MNKRGHPTRFTSCILVTVVCVILAAGLHPKDYHFRNSAELLSDGRGLRLSKYGVAFTDPCIPQPLAQKLNRTGFTLELALRPDARQEGFAFIALLHAGDSRSQLVLGQWGDHLIVMNGDDYAHRIPLPRVSARLPPTDGDDPLQVVIASGPGGTRLLLNGRLAKEDSRLRLAIPASRRPARLVLGNGTSGQYSWGGTLRSLELSEHAAARPELSISANAPSPQKQPAVPTPLTGDPLLHYKPGVSADAFLHDRGSVGADLNMPPKRVVIEPVFFAQPFTSQFVFRREFLVDVLLNVAGFIPFGLLLCIAIAARTPRSPTRIMVMVTLAGFLLSAAIETYQAWVPSRDSSILDLVLNGLGTAIGAGLFLLSRRVIQPRKPARPGHGDPPAPAAIN